MGKNMSNKKQYQHYSVGSSTGDYGILPTKLAR